jgi:hypothetical protein
VFESIDCRLPLNFNLAQETLREGICLFEGVRGTLSKEEAEYNTSTCISRGVSSSMVSAIDITATDLANANRFSYCCSPNASSHPATGIDHRRDLAWSTHGALHHV